MMAQANTTQSAPKIAVVGCGYWGKNLVRNFAELGVLSAVSDADATVAQGFAEKHNVKALSLAELLRSDVDGIAFATPATLHAEHVTAALEAGKHVFVEKPVALRVADGRSLATLAHRHGLTLMVGHLLHYHPVVRRMMELLREGRIGEVKFVSSSRLNFGKLRTEEDVLWSFAPHDISVILAIIDELPRTVSLTTTSLVSPGIADIADLHLRFPSGATARVFASWLNPFKEQKVVVVGTKGHAVFDDQLPWDDKLTIFDNTVATVNGRPEAKAVPGVKVAVPKDEPLRLECQHFVDCVRDGLLPRTDAEEALRVLAVLEAATQAGKTGAPVVPTVPVLAKSA